MLMATPRHSAFLAQTLSELRNLRGNVMHDLRTAVLMREHGASRIWRTVDRVGAVPDVMTTLCPSTDARSSVRIA